MGNDLDIRLRADRVFVENLCAMTGKSASSLATGANMAATTLNRFVSKKAKLSSTLKDSTIDKIARRWGLDYLDLTAYRKAIGDALREGRAVPEFGKFTARQGKTGGLKESVQHTFATPARDALMDRIMGATYDVWFHSECRETVEFDRLPGIVRLLYSRAKAEGRPPAAGEIKKRAADILAVVAMEGGGKK
ncbi:MAG: hypothetical protein AB7H77_06665 [Bdellovibrionales bacterium]